MGVRAPYNGLLYGSIVFIILIVLTAIILGIVFRKGQTCYAINFATILYVMAWIMWICVYLCQMFPLIVPQKTKP
ncbi:hypothetical protein TVAG_087150 [Trichomonas vaginalis G3]|uniref:Uncharacterized protein n=1 Tax=Trichomonas vaginalis (strain ATCC PRA-98 / G3) TaxID=412133 RepID=A2EN29_TRIV3|nr:ATP synthase subunit H family [Trichomonas vaginalis G3]EAY05937.1 hypothetical protein TVAG_087150 [Trichomonas vaginalis G3]KAI5530174.1 ATP synthase subunit H family [Trichomonas vaginalis G3]|eukprot:XP_001318160.1 hypothetical protein [Trichomonas vaginalis G3]